MWILQLILIVLTCYEIIKLVVVPRFTKFLPESLHRAEISVFSPNCIAVPNGSYCRWPSLLSNWIYYGVDGSKYQIFIFSDANKQLNSLRDEVVCEK